MNPNEKYFKAYYLFKRLSKLFLTLLCLTLPLTLFSFGVFAFTNSLTALFYLGGNILFGLIFSGIETLCTRKSEKLEFDFIEFTNEFIPQTKEEMIRILDKQKETVEVYRYIDTKEVENDRIIPMQPQEVYERPKVFVKKYKKYSVINR